MTATQHPSAGPAPALYDSFAQYGSGVTLVSTRDGEEDLFFIAASVLTASVDPFTIAVSMGRTRAGAAAIADGAPWAVSILAADHLGLVRILTGRTAREERRAALAAAGAQRTQEGPMVLPDALVALACTTHAVTPVADQLLVVGEVRRGSAHREAPPLLRWNRGFVTGAPIPAE
ncbi:flavin reductase family protein [Brachybacterium phenoliresistens]|uniref:flavin reductase family protein n=1 Tax=Brachybacterium phenoliresistens TaxID=396014 RepID=UPI0031CE0960